MRTTKMEMERRNGIGSNELIQSVGRMERVKQLTR